MRWALVALTTTGCAISIGTGHAGQWRAGRVVDSTACVLTPTGACARTVVIGRRLPARRYGGGSLAFGSAGYGQLRGDGVTRHGAIIDGYYEYYRGRGAWAVGGRAGAEVALGFGSRVFFTVPVTAMVHLGDRWGQVYGGVGYSPVATESLNQEMAPPARWHHDSFHAIVGTRIVLRDSLTGGFRVNPEVRVQKLGDGVLTSLTCNIGLNWK